MDADLVLFDNDIDVKLVMSAGRVIREEALPYTCTDLQVLPAGTGEQLGDFASIVVAQYGLKEAQR